MIRHIVAFFAIFALITPSIVSQPTLDNEMYVTTLEQRLTTYRQTDVRKSIGDCGNYVTAHFSQATRTVHIPRNSIKTTIISGGNPGEKSAVGKVQLDVNLLETVPIESHACRKIHFIFNWGCKCGHCSNSETIHGTIQVTILFDITDETNIIRGIPRDPPTMIWTELTLSPFQCQGSVFGHHFHSDYTKLIQAELQKQVHDLDSHFIEKYVPTADPIFTPLDI